MAHLHDIFSIFRHAMKRSSTVLLVLSAMLFTAGLSRASPRELHMDTESVGDSETIGEETALPDSDSVIPDTATRSPEDTLFGEDDTLPKAVSTDSTRHVDTAQHAELPIDSGQSAQRSDSIGVTVMNHDSTPPPPTVPVRPAWLYRGISLDQDAQARRMIGYLFNFDWNSVEKAGKKLQRIEKKGHLAPLSSLLMVGMMVFRIQNGEYEDDHAKKGLLRDIEKISQKGLELAIPEKAPDSLVAINLFITGGIKGFLATLEINKSPIDAARNGFAAHKLLENALLRDTSLSDAALGLGLFNCVLAKAPLLVRGALNLIGTDVSLERGLDFLRRSANRGCYTNDIAKLYLVRFLSPYWVSEVQEKNRILRSLESAYPANPYFVFLELEENLCFHPAALSGYSITERVKRQIGRFKTNDYSARRYATLVKWQYLLVNQFPTTGLAPDTTCNLRAFSYYPAFLRALKEKFLYENERSVSKRDRARRLRHFRSEGAKAVRTLSGSPDMPAELKNLYFWHIKDGLRVHP
jgi:hypothetical protein